MNFPIQSVPVDFNQSLLFVVGLVMGVHRRSGCSFDRFVREGQHLQTVCACYFRFLAAISDVCAVDRGSSDAACTVESQKIVKEFNQFGDLESHKGQSQIRTELYSLVSRLTVN